MRMQVLFPLLGILFVLSGCEAEDDDDMADDDVVDDDDGDDDDDDDNGDDDMVDDDTTDDDDADCCVEVEAYDGDGIGTFTMCATPPFPGGPPAAEVPTIRQTADGIELYAGEDINDPAEFALHVLLPGANGPGTVTDAAIELWDWNGLFDNVGHSATAQLDNWPAPGERATGVFEGTVYATGEWWPPDYVLEIDVCAVVVE